MQIAVNGGTLRLKALGLELAKELHELGVAFLHPVATCNQVMTVCIEQGEDAAAPSPDEGSIKDHMSGAQLQLGRRTAPKPMIDDPC